MQQITQILSTPCPLTSLILGPQTRSGSLPHATKRENTSSSDEKSEICRFFALNGHCRWGNKCKYVHQFDEGSVTAEPRSSVSQPAPSTPRSSSLIGSIMIPSFLASNEKGTIISLQGTFGFLRVEKTAKSVFFHRKNVFAPDAELTVGDTVLFDLILRRERGKEEAVNVRLHSMQSEILAAFAGGEVELPTFSPSKSEKKAQRSSKKFTIVFDELGLKPEWKS